jgi:protein TonB
MAPPPAFAGDPVASDAEALEAVALRVFPVRSALQFESPRAAVVTPAEHVDAPDRVNDIAADGAEGSGPVMSGGVIAESELRRLVYRAPDYPRRAYRLREQGWVELEFLIGADGVPAGIEVVAAEPEGVFEDNAVAALQRWRYEPVLADGGAVEQRARVRIRFEIR